MSTSPKKRFHFSEDSPNKKVKEDCTVNHKLFTPGVQLVGFSTAGGKPITVHGESVEGIENRSNKWKEQIESEFQQLPPELRPEVDDCLVYYAEKNENNNNK